jgi:hypothetical protein
MSIVLAPRCLRRVADKEAAGDASASARWTVKGANSALARQVCGTLDTPGPPEAEIGAADSGVPSNQFEGVAL